MVIRHKEEILDPLPFEFFLWCRRRPQAKIAEVSAETSLREFSQLKHLLNFSQMPRSGMKAPAGAKYHS